MKFTKEQAVESITAKFADKAKGIDLVRTITEAVSNGMEMVGENSEMELDAFVAIVEKNVSSALGLARHLKTSTVTELQQQIAELQKKLELTTPPPPPDKQIETDDPAMKALLEKMSAIEAKLQSSEKEKTIAEKRQQLIAKMGESIKDKEWINSYLAEIAITEETDVESKAKDYVAFYNKTQTRGGKITPKSTGEGVVDDAKYVSDSLKSAAALMKQREGIMSTTVNQ